MLANAYSEELKARIDRPANDLFGASDPELWGDVDAILNCADFSEGEERLETSLIRFPLRQRQYFAALCYLSVVEKHGHSAYFSSAYAFGFEDALECFAALGRFDVTMLMEDASFAHSQAAYAAAGGGALAFADPGTEFDLNLARLNPVADLPRFTRRYPDAFDRW